jgi:hydrogenase large subunit
LTEHYILAYQIRLKAHELCAIWSGKMPHMASIIVGGVTIRPRIDNITTSLWRLQELRDFIDNVYLPDVIMLAQIYRDYLHIGSSCGNMLAFGQFDLDNEPDVTKRKRLFPMGRIENGELKSVDPGKIQEDLKYARYQSSKSDHPIRSETNPDPAKPLAYSWLKAPRYDDKVYEVGPLARIKVAYASGKSPKVNQLVDETLENLQVGQEALCSVMGRHLARAMECKIVADAMADMILQVKLEGDVCTAHEIPESTEGMGLWGAARGALGHWIEVKNKKIARYQAVVPTTWNASPKDNKEQHGPVEHALIGSEVEDMENPFCLARIVRSFDPCIACAVHLLSPGKSVKKFRLL